MYVILVRHFKTNSDEKINYDKISYEADNYIKDIVKYVKRHNIEAIEFHSSPQDRTFLTAFILCNILKDQLKISIKNPVVNYHINRDPNKKKIDETRNYFYRLNHNNYYDGKKLFIYVTHSSVYYNIFKSIVETAPGNNKIDKNLDAYIHSNSMSRITCEDTLRYTFDKNMR